MRARALARVCVFVAISLIFIRFGKLTQFHILETGRNQKRVSHTTGRPKYRQNKSGYSLLHSQYDDCCQVVLTAS